MTVVVKGLTELRRDLKKLGAAAESKEIQKGLKAAADIVAQDAKARVPSRTGEAAGSIRSGASGPRAYVRGGVGVPYYGWLDFGSRTPRYGNPRSRGPWSGSGKGPDRGRYIYAALDAKQSEVLEAVTKALDDLAKSLNL